MRKSVIVIIVAALVVLYMSIFTVQQTERGIILRFGKVVRDNDNKPIIYEPGLHFKIPFIETVKMLDARIQTLDVQADRYLTRENKDLMVDSYLKWRITDFSRYYVATGGGNPYQAETLLKRKFSDRLRSEFGRLNVKDIITDSRGRLTVDVRDTLNKGSGSDTEATKDADQAIASAAARFDKEIKGNSSVVNPNSMAALGIQVVDVRIKRIELPSEVSEAIYQRMRAEREAVARQHRSQGQEEAVKIRAAADKTVTETLAEAERTALKLHGEGDAMATKLFADAFNQDPNFYAFIRSLRAYEKSFSKNGDDVMILSPDTDFFRYMRAPTKQRAVQ
ncbi:Modulator of FtsH protease HflC [Arsenophonus endosymbiont of Aleurodicus floccissimus]|uniref:protease modulator HflC n=1 Tax=Arsenophonus endosymbiont of Aleurodicus floccissimus TaxID=2152761 RepID=UPI000E6B0B35|nr:protease modulator HflC [Arsenophonus endosymbiont of Aleurodicus floccissimus]SPP32040.1 Modulator of FtsH protease HflC [Arsenophonus endosymbiont of Aleurodicus floccissimus]